MSTDQSKLAICGGEQIVPPDFRFFDHPVLSERFLDRIGQKPSIHQVVTFRSPIVSEVQEQIQRIFEVPYVLMTNSGTSAIFAMFYGLGLKPGDEVLVPVYTFFATATPLFVLGCKPVLIDCLEDGNVDPEDVLRKITPRTRAIIVTHMWGFPCKMDELLQISRTYALPLLEDASHAHGARYRGKIAGTFGVAGAWSLGAQKIITGGQGGVFCTADREVYERAILLTQANNKDKSEVGISHLVPFAQTGIGLNLRIHPFSARVISDQFCRFDDMLRDRRRAADFLCKEINLIRGLRAPAVPYFVQPAWYAFPVFYDETELGVSKAVFVEAVVAEGAVSVDIPGSTCPLTEFSAFARGRIDFQENSETTPLYSLNQFPGARDYQRRMFKLPTWYGPHCMEYATAYVAALRKVVRLIDQLPKN